MKQKITENEETLFSEKKNRPDVVSHFLNGAFRYEFLLARFGLMNGFSNKVK